MKTRDTINLSYLHPELKEKYKGLGEAADKAYLFMGETYEKDLTSSQIIYEMTNKLEYSLHFDSVILVHMESDEQKDAFIEKLLQKDNLGLYIVKWEFDITLTACAYNNYSEYVSINTAIGFIIPEFPLIDGNDIQPPSLILPERNTDIKLTNHHPGILLNFALIYIYYILLLLL